MADSPAACQMQNDVKNIQERVLVMNTEMGELRDAQKQQNDTLITIQTDVSWLKKFFWVVATASIGAVLTGFINLLRT